jgi:N6-adenosine-specific RNA methylase IME4
MKALPPIPFRRYGLILADPPWHFETFSDAVSAKSPDAHYPCMSLDDIAALWWRLGLDRMAARDCVLALWITWPVLERALWLLRSWGFAYKTGGSWGKVTASGKPALGTGYIYRGAGEAWLIGTRGAPKVRSHGERNFILGDGGRPDVDLAAPVEWDALPDLIVAARREHSRKPPVMQDSLERLFDGPYLELFARSRRPGWEAWGNDIDKFAGAA